MSLHELREDSPIFALVLQLHQRPTPVLSRLSPTQGISHVALQQHAHAPSIDQHAVRMVRQAVVCPIHPALSFFAGVNLSCAEQFSRERNRLPDRIRAYRESVLLYIALWGCVLFLLWAVRA